MRIVEWKVLRQVLAYNIAAGFGKLAVLVGVARGSTRPGYYRYPETIVLEKLPLCVVKNILNFSNQ